MEKGQRAGSTIRSSSFFKGLKERSLCIRLKALVSPGWTGLGESFNGLFTCSRPVYWRQAIYHLSCLRHNKFCTLILLVEKANSFSKIHRFAAHPAGGQAQFLAQMHVNATAKRFYSRDTVMTHA
jgi:hypothetical protein